MIQLANGLRNGERTEDALRINIALLDAQRRSGLSPGYKLASCETLASKSYFTTAAARTPPRPKMILTNCAACAAPLAHDAPRCVRCKLRYCNSTCQHNTRWALSVRDHIRETHGSMVVLETNEGVELFGRHITGGAIWAAAKTFKAMGASDAEIRAALPAFGRLGIDAAEMWQ